MKIARRSTELADLSSARGAFSGWHMARELFPSVTGKSVRHSSASDQAPRLAEAFFSLAERTFASALRSFT